MNNSRPREDGESVSRPISKRIIVGHRDMPGGNTSTRVSEVLDGNRNQVESEIIDFDQQKLQRLYQLCKMQEMDGRVPGTQVEVFNDLAGYFVSGENYQIRMGDREVYCFQEDGIIKIFEVSKGYNYENPTVNRGYQFMTAKEFENFAEEVLNQLEVVTD